LAGTVGLESERGSEGTMRSLGENGVARKWRLTMDRIKKLFGNLLGDEQGGEVLEYALIVGLIVVAAIAAITAVGGKEKKKS